MKTILNGKRYDTNTAWKISTYRNMEEKADPGYLEETLYLKKRVHEFFLYGRGGSNSRYAAAAAGGTWGPGEKIIPLTIDAAEKWLLSHDMVAYDKLYGPNMKTHKNRENSHLNGFVLSDDTRARIDRFAAARGWKISETVEYIINQYLDSLED
jgi:hypothetical protein